MIAVLTIFGGDGHWNLYSLVSHNSPFTHQKTMQTRSRADDVESLSPRGHR